MPTLETPAGKPVDVTPVDKAAVDAKFEATMADDGPDEKQPPKRAPRTAAAAQEKPRARAVKADKPRTQPKAPVALDDRQRAEGVKGWAQIAAGIALMGSKAAGTKPDGKPTDGAVALRADAVVIASAGEQLADACIQVAHADAKFAAALDRVCAVGPYGALISVGVGIVAQCVRNHKPDFVIAGTVPPDELLKAAEDGAAAA